MLTTTESPSESETEGAHHSVETLPEEFEQDLVQVFKLLSDSTRLRILFNLLQEEEMHVTALCERLQQSQPGVSHHLGLLRMANLIQARRDGKHNYYSVRTNRFHSLMSDLFQHISSSDQRDIHFKNFVLTQTKSVDSPSISHEG